MPLSLSQLTLIIEMTEVEMAETRKIIVSPSSSKKQMNDAGEHALQLLALSSTLQQLYREQFHPGDNALPYDKLITDIHQRRL